MNLTPHSMKSSETSPRQEQQSFFLPAIPRGTDTLSFDSFISREPQDDPRSKEIEEEEKAKKRKKAEQTAALAAAQAPSTPTPAVDELSLAPTPAEQQRTLAEQQKPSPSPSENDSRSGGARKPASRTEATPQDSQPSSEPVAELPNESSEEKPSTDKPVASGTDHAVESDDMISLAAMDALDAGQPVAAAKDPSITTSGRLNTFTVADRLATTAITPSQSGSNTNPESNLNQPGAQQLSASPRTATAQKSAATAATSMLRSLRVEIEKFTQTNSSQLQLELPVSDSESVKVRLSMRGNELHTVFVTESAELREALQKAWPEFSQTSRDRGFRFNDPAFQQAANQQNSPTGDRENRKRTTPSETPDANTAISKPKKSTPAQSPDSPSSSVSLWA
jgi:hypothetical protein